ncbi:MAG: alpha-amylase [Oscillatoriales cyanobacterium C42_A2020_001]|nr:alpha-amylase [Leptolyngbyaceae cyanobacterium C42_A2020_001]
MTIGKPTTELNGVMMQYFQWYLPADGTHWHTLQTQAQTLADAGFTAIWLPPAYKGAAGKDDVGYAAYDLYDLGEFFQKGSIRTKYGTREEYLAAVQTLQQTGLQVYADAVLTHRHGGDEVEECKAIAIAPDTRNHPSSEIEVIQAKTCFTFSGRNSKHSNFQWHQHHFDAVNHNLRNSHSKNFYHLQDKLFETEVDPRYWDESFQFACDVDTNNPEVQAELKHWGEWILDTTKIDGFRLDAVKHARPTFFNEWLAHVRRHAKNKLFAVGDYWADDVESLHGFISRTGGQLSLFDVPLHYNFHRASRAGGHFDMRRLLFGTLMREQPALAVTFVENHDSQPLQQLESVVEPWFKPLAYALILLRREGYPCVFYGDYYGGHYWGTGRDGKTYEVWLDSHRWLIDQFLYARKHYAHGEQYDYFDHPECIGWTRLGTPEFPKAMAVMMSDGPPGSKWMEVGRPNTTFHDLTRHVKSPVITNEFGWGDFSCSGGSVSVWVEA